MKLPESWNTLTLLSKILAIVLFVSLPFIGFYFGVKYCNLGFKEKSEIDMSATIPTLSSPTMESSQDKSIIVKYAETDEKEFFVTSPLMSKMSGSYFNYSRDIKRFSSDLTPIIKESYPNIKYYPDSEYYTPFIISMWSYQYDSCPFRLKNYDKANFSFQVAGETNFVDVGIRVDNYKYPPLTFENLKKYLGSVYEFPKSYFTSAVFSVNDKAVVIEWTPMVPVINGYDDRTKLLATMYVDGPENYSLTNAIQLRVVMPAYLELTEGVSPGDNAPNPKDVVTIKLQQVVDSYFRTIVDIFNQIDTRYYPENINMDI